MPMVEAVTKYAAFIDRPEAIAYQLEKAVHIAQSGRPGPVWLDIPLDIQGAFIDPKKLRHFKPPAKLKPQPNPNHMKKLVNSLKSASRPVILAGYGGDKSILEHDIRDEDLKQKIAQNVEKGVFPGQVTITKKYGNQISKVEWLYCSTAEVYEILQDTQWKIERIIYDQTKAAVAVLKKNA